MESKKSEGLFTNLTNILSGTRSLIRRQRSDVKSAQTRIEQLYKNKLRDIPKGDTALYITFNPGTEIEATKLIKEIKPSQVFYKSTGHSNINFESENWSELNDTGENTSIQKIREECTRQGISFKDDVLPSLQCIADPPSTISGIAFTLKLINFLNQQKTLNSQTGIKKLIIVTSSDKKDKVQEQINFLKKRLPKYKLESIEVHCKDSSTGRETYNKTSKSITKIIDKIGLANLLVNLKNIGQHSSLDVIRYLLEHIFHAAGNQFFKNKE